MTPSSDLIVSVSGIRGIVGKGLTAEAALVFASAHGTYLQGGRVVVGSDGRPSGLVLRHAVLAGLLDAGCNVEAVGVVPTPTIGFAVRYLQAAGAIQITASHNPAQWNGLKLFGPDGAVLTAAEGRKIQALFETGQFRHADHQSLGTVKADHHVAGWHRDRVLQLVDVAAIRQRNFRVFLDANGGAGGPLGRSLLEALNVQVIPHGCGADGNFLHPPEPIAENLKTILGKIPESNADLGFVLDPDADRLAIIDEKGQYLGEELTLALAVLLRLKQEKGPVVINMSTSRLVEDLAKQFGVPCHRSAVGEANVVETMRKVGAVIGGEGNGGVIDPRVGWVRDPFIGMALILNLLSQEGKELSDVVAGLPRYHIVKDKYPVSRDRLPKLNEKLIARWPEAVSNGLDGLRLDWEDRWLHVRPSNTEPIVRVIAEAPHEEAAKKLCLEVGQLLNP